MTEKELFLPEAYAPSDEAADGAARQACGPFDRPDLCTGEEDEPAGLWPAPGAPVEPCPCCGTDIPADPSPGYICPVCWWETDPFLTDETEPSDQNHGLSLAEARLNFRAFGICAPWLLPDKN